MLGVIGRRERSCTEWEGGGSSAPVCRRISGGTEAESWRLEVGTKRKGPCSGRQRTGKIQRSRCLQNVVVMVDEDQFRRPPRPHHTCACTLSRAAKAPSQRHGFDFPAVALGAAIHMPLQAHTPLFSRPASRKVTSSENTILLQISLSYFVLTVVRFRALPSSILLNRVNGSLGFSGVGCVW